ncbi:MAG: c-type cytochrome domain-containing protein [Pirellulales bacterium]
MTFIVLPPHLPHRTWGSLAACGKSHQRSFSTWATPPKAEVFGGREAPCRAAAGFFHSLRTLSAFFVAVAGVLAPHAVRAEGEGLPVSAIERDTAVRYQDEIVPMLSANCTACHNEKVTEGGLSMDTLERIIAGGDSGPGVVAGKSAESLLFLRAAHRLDDAMPPEDNGVGAVNLSPEQLGLLQRWIDEGAEAGPLAMRPVDWRPLPPGVGGVLAVALSGDGRVTAAARGGRVTLYDTRSGEPLTPAAADTVAGSSLIDPTLVQPEGDVSGLAHADVVTSMAFSPVADLVATGSFRTIKLWARNPAGKLADIPGSGGGVLLGVAQTPATIAAIGLTDGRLAVADVSSPQIAESLRILGNPGPAAVAGVLSADGSTLYVASSDHAVTAYRVGDGEVLGRVQRPMAMSSLGLTMGESQLITAEADGVVRCWKLPLPPPAENAAPAELVREIAGATFPVAAIREVPGLSGHVVAGCGDGVARLWNMADGGNVREFQHGGVVLSLDVNGDGTRLATVGGVPGVKLWNLADGTLVAHTQGDHEIADRLAALDADLRVLGQDTDHGKAQVTAAEEAKTKAAEELKQMQEKLAAAEKDAKEKADASAAAVAAREEADRTAAGAVAAVPLAESSVEAAKAVVAETTAAAEAAAVSRESFAKAIDGAADAAEALKPLDAAVAAATAAKDAAAAAVAAAEAQVQRAKARVEETMKMVEEQKKAESTASDAAKASETALTSARRDHEFATTQVTRAEEAVPQRQAELAAVETKRTETEALRTEVAESQPASMRPFVSVSFHRDGRRLACLDSEGSVLECGGLDGLPRRRMRVSDGAVSLTATADHRLLVCGGPDFASVWDERERWTLLRTVGGERLPPAMDDDPAGPPVDSVQALAFSPDGTLVASGSGRASRGGEIKLWKVDDGSLVRNFDQPHSDTVVSLAFSRDGVSLASGGTDRLAKMHDVATGAAVKSFEGHTGHVLGVAWQANGRRLATAGADNVVKVWDVTSGEQQRTIGGLGREVTGVRFLGEGEEIAATSGDATVRVFNAASGGEVRRLQGAGDFVQSLAVAGGTLAAGSQDGRMLIWAVENPQPLHTLEPSPAE